jgi:hypothetical protein
VLESIQLVDDLELELDSGESDTTLSIIVSEAIDGMLSIPAS